MLSPLCYDNIILVHI